MADGGKSKSGGKKGRKIGRQGRNSCDTGQTRRTETNKIRRAERQETMMARPAHEVSRNCLTSRAKRGDVAARLHLNRH